MNDFFDLNNDDFSTGNTGGGRKEDPNLWAPDPKKYNGKYQAVGRLVPYIFDKALSKYTKYSAKFWNPVTKESLWVDCPSNWGDPSILWDAATVIGGLKNDEPELHKQLSDRFSRWFNHHSVIYIRKDPQRKDLEGTLKIFKFTKQIDDIIDSQIHPEGDDLLESAVSVNPYHLLEGKDFFFNVSMKTQYFRDWSKCKFVDEITPFIFKIGDKEVKVENNEKSIKLVSEYLKKNTPKMDPYLHKVWDDETRKKVAEFMVSCINNRTVLDMILERTKDDVTKKLILDRLNGISSSSSSTSSLLEEEEDDLLFEGSSESSNTSIEEPLAEESVAEEGGKDEYDKLFDDL